MSHHAGELIGYQPEASGERGTPPSGGSSATPAFTMEDLARMPETIFLTRDDIASIVALARTDAITAVLEDLCNDGPIYRRIVNIARMQR